MDLLGFTKKPQIYGLIDKYLLKKWKGQVETEDINDADKKADDSTRKNHDNRLELETGLKKPIPDNNTKFDSSGIPEEILPTA